MTTLDKNSYRVARALVGALFLVAGLGKVAGFSGVAGYMASVGIPFASLLLVGTIALEVGGGLLMILGWQARWAALLLALFTVPVTLLFHAFWNADAASFQNQFNHFLKNVAIIGGLIIVYLNEKRAAVTA
jgi:putative oxidoreductase